MNTRSILVFVAIAAGCLLPSSAIGGRSIDQIITKMDNEAGLTAKQLLGDSYKTCHFWPIDVKSPTNWRMYVEFVDSSPNGRLAPVFQMIGLAVMFSTKFPIAIPRVEVVVLAENTDPRITFNLAIPESKAIRKNWMRLKDIDRLSDADQVALLQWIGSWQVTKEDASWTAADKLLAATETISAGPKSPRKPATLQIGFHIEETTIAYDSLKTHKELWVAATSGQGAGSRVLPILRRAMAQHKALDLPAGTEVTLTGKATGLVSQITSPALRGTWWISNQALKAANVDVPPANYEAALEDEGSRE